MHEHHVEPESVVLVPRSEGDLQIGVAPADAGELQAVMTVTTESLGQFVVPLTAHQLALLSVVCKQLLELDADQVSDLRRRLLDKQQINGEDDDCE